VKDAVKDSIYDKLTLGNKKDEKGNRVRKLLLWRAVASCRVDDLEHVQLAMVLYTPLYPSFDRLLMEYYIH
jgi:hypothetical protein